MKSSRRKDDAATRILRAAGRPEELDKIMQDECRRRAAKKLAATLSCPGFRFPTELSAEQCTSDALADFHASLIAEGSEVVDLTCGLAIDAFHIARRAASVTCIDIDSAVASCVASNARALGLENVDACCADCRQWLEQHSDGRFDVAFIDPARRADDGSRLFSLARCHPDVVAMLPAIERVARRLIIKASPMLDISRTIAELRNVRAIHAVGTRSECKELLVDIEFGYEGPVTVSADTVGCGSLTFTLGENAPAEAYAAELHIGDIIGEPWPAAMKVMPRGLLSGEQLHPSTFLWRNPSPEDFPGNLYRVTRVEPFSSSTLRRLAREKLAASVATRNFPLAAAALKQRLKTTENADCRLMATTLSPSMQILAFLAPLSEKNA